MVQKEPVIEFSCPQCGASLTADASQAGDSGPCPDCGAEVTCPHPSAPEANLGADAPSASPRSGQHLPGPANPQNRSVEPGIRIFRDAKGPQTSEPASRQIPARASTSPKRAAIAAGGIAVLVLLLALLARVFVGPETDSGPDRPQAGSQEKPSPDPASESLAGTSTPNPLEPANPDEPVVPVAAAVPGDEAQASQLKALLDSGGEFDVPSVDDPSAVDEPGLLDPSPELGEDPLLTSGPDSQDLRFEHPDFPTTGKGSLLEGAREFIHTYTAAPTWEALVPMSRDGEAMRPEMEAHYAQHPYAPDPVTALSFVNTHGGADGKSRYFIYMVSTRSHPDGFLMNIEATGDSYLANWRPYIEFKERLFDAFASKPDVSKGNEPRTFHVFLSRAHYFGEEVPKSSEKLAFEASVPAGEKSPYTVFVPLYTDLGRKLNRELQWGRSYLVVADFRWSVDPNDAEEEPYLRLMQIRRFSWQQSLEETESP